MELTIIMLFRIKVIWHTIDNVISFDISFHFIYILSKALLSYIYGAIDLGRKMLYIA